MAKLSSYIRQRATMRSGRPTKIAYNSIKPIVFFCLLILSITITIVYRTTNLDPEPDILPSNIISHERYPETLPELTHEIATIIDNKPGVYSVQFDDFDGTDAININEEKVFTAASVIKIPILASVYQLANQGELNLDEAVQIKSYEVQNWGTGVIRYENQPITHTIREMSRLLIEKSDNTAAYVLTHSVIGEKKIQEIVNKWGLSQTNIKENETSNQDIDKLMHMMFEGKIANPKLTDEMIGWMDDSDFENRLPRLLPKDADVFHKIGNEVQTIHDVGVISLDGDNYYLGVMTTGITDIAKTEDIIAEISDLVFRYTQYKIGQKE